jgi:starch synthase (maltosyl-transferring)
MKSVLEYSGPARVVIDHVSPSVGGGAFPIKCVASEPMHVEAHVIADGHDHLDAMLAWRREGSRHWAEVPMRDLGNDEFAGEFTPQKPGFYEYRVIGWADAFRNWHIGFVKKSDAGDSKIGVELEIGAQLVADAAERAKGEDQQTLQGWARFMGDHSRDLMQKVALARTTDFYTKVRQPIRTARCRRRGPRMPSPCRARKGLLQQLV